MSSLLLSLLILCWVLTFTLSGKSVLLFISMLEHWRASLSARRETEVFDLWGGLVLLLTDHAWHVFSRSHSTDPQCTTTLFLCVLQNGSWMQPGLRDNPVVLRPLVDDYQAPKMADRPSDLQCGGPKNLHDAWTINLSMVHQTSRMADKNEHKDNHIILQHCWKSRWIAVLLWSWMDHWSSRTTAVQIMDYWTAEPARKLKS